MSANSTARRAVKQVAHRALGERGYAWLQAASMARDIRSGSPTVCEPELDVLRAVRAGDTVIDVGANYGFWSVPMSRAVGATGHVLAFEPVPFTVTSLRRVLQLLRVRNVAVHAAACGAETGELELRVPVQTSGAISAGQAHFAARDDTRPGSEPHVRWSESTTVAAPVVRLDDVVAPNADVSLIKIDVEGAELDVLRGADALVERSHPILVLEINPWFLEGFGLTVDDLVGHLASRGYSLNRYDDGELHAVDPSAVVEANYVFVHPERPFTP